MELSASEVYQQLQELDEHPRLEAKSCEHSLGLSVMETVCAFSNEPGMGGGYILIGVRKVPSLFEDSYEVLDLPHADKLQLDLVANCTTMFNISVRPQIEPCLLFKKRVLLVFVPELAPSQKPLCFKGKQPPEGAFRRSGSADVQCRQEDIDYFYQDRTRESFDESIIDGATIADISLEEVAYYRELRKATHPDAPELQYSDTDLLLCLGCARTKGEALQPTVAGILLFGTAFALRRWFPMMRIDYIRVPGRNWMKDPDKRFTSLEIRAPLIRAIQRAMAAMLDDLMREFNLPDGELQRRDVSLIPDKVIREVVVNAVMHRCYSVQSPIQIIRFTNHVEVRNPGYSLKSPELYCQPGSQSRNPKIAAVLHELNIAETKGSGIRVMQLKMRDANLSPPYFDSDRHANHFLASLMLHLMGQDTIAWLANFRDLQLTDDEAHALFVVREYGQITSLAFAMMVDFDQAAASASLRRLCRAVLLVRKGSDEHRWYEPTKYLLAPTPLTTRKRQQLAKSGKIRDDEGSELSRQGGELGSELSRQGGEPQRLDSDDYGDFAAIPEDIKLKLPVLKPRSDRATVELAILILCEWRPLYPAEIAVYLDRRSVRRLVDDYISSMVTQELLMRTIPDKPTHPAQKYTIAPKGSQRLICHI